MEETLLITGASRGLGLALTRHFLTLDRHVTALSRTLSPEVSSLQSSSLGKLEVVLQDLARLDQIPNCIREIERRFACSALINCAAVVEDGLFVRQSSKGIAATLAVNLHAPAILCQEVAKRMLIRHEGRIVNISSLSGSRAVRWLGIYGAAKAGLEQLTRVLALELAPRNIAVNAIAPGYLETDMSSGLSEIQRERIKARTPTGRITATTEICTLAEFLIVKAPLSITGQVIHQDGGFSL
jgi:3-oxoacyl-[acyl-carrier protein] reductase